MEQVILLHGILRTGRSMRMIEKAFIKAGYKVHNITYNSNKFNISQIADNVKNILAENGYDENLKTNFVCHSMGGLICRVLIQDGSVKNLGRVVFLGTPHKGSEVAEFIRDWKIYKKLYGPAGQQLVVTKNEFHLQLKPIDYEAAGIAGTWSVSFIGSYLIGRQSDGTVAVDSVQIEGLKDFAKVRVPHTFLMQSRNVIKMCLSFIKTGRLHQ